MLSKTPDRDQCPNYGPSRRGTQRIGSFHRADIVSKLFAQSIDSSAPICEPISSLSINSSVKRTGEKTESTCHFNRLGVFEMLNISGTLPAQVDTR
jgi:hypothetical protein